jgi:hypothetical protein
VQTNGKAVIYVGDGVYPPEPPVCFAIVPYYLFWRYRFRGVATAAGLRHSRSPQECNNYVLEDNFQGFYEKIKAKITLYPPLFFKKIDIFLNRSPPQGLFDYAEQEKYCIFVSVLSQGRPVGGSGFSIQRIFPDQVLSGFEPSQTKEMALFIMCF